VGSSVFAGFFSTVFVLSGFISFGFVSFSFVSLMLRPWKLCNASSRLLGAAFEAAALGFLPGHSFRTLGRSSSDSDPASEVPESEPHHTLSSRSASSCSSSGAIVGASDGMLTNGFDFDRADFKGSLPTSFTGRLRVLSGATTLCCNSFVDAFKGASLICLFLGVLPVGTFAIRFEASSSSGGSSLKKSLSV